MMHNNHIPSFKIKYHVIKNWPSLAWVAILEPNRQSIIVKCGEKIETRKDWFCEAVWDGEFDDGDFDQTDIVAGSGARHRDQSLTFVSAGSLMDRLQYIQVGKATYISNSILALAAEVDANVDLTTDEYLDMFGSIAQGLRDYVSDFPTSKGNIKLVYYENLIWNGNTLTEIKKPRIKRNLSSYGAYLSFMKSTMAAIVKNANSSSRISSFSPIVPLSSGYDSPAVATIAAAAGVKEGISLVTDGKGRNDSGVEVGKILGYDVTACDRSDWQKHDLPEVDGIAASGNAAEVSVLAMADNLEDRLILTGFWGGQIWKKSQPETRPIFGQHDGSGVSWSEIRLTLGFINCPITYWGGTQIADIVAISNSEEMDYWSIGGHYDRPIPRRITETAGVPRECFGQNKQGVSEHVLGAERFLTKESAEDYERWIRANRLEWIRKGKLYPSPAAGKVIDKFLLHAFCPISRKLMLPILRRISTWPGMSATKQWSHFLRQLIKTIQHRPLHYRRYTFPWAFEHAKGKYREGKTILKGLRYAHE